MERLRYRPRFPTDLLLTLGPLRHGPRDPTIRLSRDRVERATRTPEGPAATAIERVGSDFEVTSWGPGAAWALASIPPLLGGDDDPAQLVPCDDVVARLHRSMGGLRVGRTGAVVEALVPTIIEQKVQSIVAHDSYRRLVWRYGEPAPGPLRLRLAPEPAIVAALPNDAFHPLGIEGHRARIVRRVCANARRLEEAVDMDPVAARQRLEIIPGVGVWTSAEAARAAFGDADAVSVGDFHLPNTVAWVLVGEDRADDSRMLELLEPYMGQRARVVRLIEATGRMAPRRGPRMPLRAIERI